MFDKENKKLACHHGVLALVIAVLLGFILIVLVFKIGMMVGMSKSSFYSCGTANYQKDFSKHMVGKFSAWKKSAYSSYKEVVKLTESGFVVKDSDNKEQTIVISEDTVIIKGIEKTGNEVSVGDKVYVVGSSNESGQVEASMVKILDPDAKEFKK